MPINDTNPILDLTELRSQFGMQMTEEQCQHIEGIIIRFAYRVYAKYSKGQIEHHGDLWKKSILLTAAQEEADDLQVYLDSLQQQINEAGIELGDPTLSD